MVWRTAPTDSICSSEMPRRAFLAITAAGLLAAPLAAGAQPTGRMSQGGTGRRTSLRWMACRMSIAVMGLAACGCVARPIETDVRFVTLVLVLSAVVVFLVCTGILAFVSSRRRARKLAKICVAFVAGSICGALWILFVDTVVNAAMPGVMNEPGLLLLGVVTAALVAASLLSTGNRLHKLVGLSAMVIGLHTLALPLAALIAFLIGGVQRFPTASVRPALTAVILRIRLAGDLPTVGLSVGGLLVGVVLVFIGDRVLRRGRRSSSRTRFDLERPHV